MKPFVSTIALAATVLLAAGADAAMCVKKSGVIVVRDACRAKETPMSTNDFVGAPGTPGEDGADGLEGPRGAKGEKGDPSGLRVVDSTGKLVGIADVDDSDSIAVRVPNVGRAIVYTDSLDPSGFYQGEAYLYHEATGCQGPALAEVARYDLVSWAGVFANTAYFPHGPGTLRTIASYEYVTTSCTTFLTARGLCCSDLSAPEDWLVAPAVTVPLSTLGTPPFSIAD